MRSFQFGTKAETLESLRQQVTTAEILNVYYFTVGSWRAESDKILKQINLQFGDGTVAIRSSAVGEDGAHESRAGAYISQLNVSASDFDLMRSTIEQVCSSYDGNPLDQVLIQPMLEDVVMSGVLMTRCLEDGAPYYTISYDDESGRTDSITGGTIVSKTVHVYHDCKDEFIQSDRIRRLVSLARDLEVICGRKPLDIEFGMTSDGRLVLFQVRRISVWKNWRAWLADEIDNRIPQLERFLEHRSFPRQGVAGKSTILGIMPDWNPAEIIGTTPSRLSASLYRELITRHVWRDARATMRYRQLPGEELMVTIAGRPYIDVRNSFNSFLPAGLSEPIAQLLVDAWLQRLADQPELHDKVEFEIAHTCLDFSFEHDFRDRYIGLLKDSELAEFRAALGSVTRAALDLSPEGTLTLAEGTIRGLARKQDSLPLRARQSSSSDEKLYQVSELLEQCRLEGTLPFSVLARHAFIAESILRSAKKRGALEDERLNDFRRSVGTITTELSKDLISVASGKTDPAKFLTRYGHLRPGTYDINSMRYDARDDIFSHSLALAVEEKAKPFALTMREVRDINHLISESKLVGDADELLSYARRAIAGREYAKFVFSRSLSDALELLAAWGEDMGLGRAELAHIEISDYLAAVICPTLRDQHSHFVELASEGESLAKVCRALKLGYLIRGAVDIHVVPVYRSAPNFVGSRSVRGPAVLMNGQDSQELDVYGRIVCIENADPGFDFIFSKGIIGLVTKYGGANSHMAIRCSELGIPAAIGCGEQTFDRILNAGHVELNGSEQTIIPLYDH